MRLATVGNLRVAAAAQTSFGQALQLGYRTGTITGMLTDGLGLLGGSIIFLVYGEHAYEALLGFGFGGTLLALFMRVGGGIYTKAADVGADLVGKLEAGIPEDDPRNAATIADNVGDNVGDCAGMAADIFESYEVTIVAAMILGIASFGHKGVIFPLLVRAIGVIASIISTYSVRAGDKGTVAEAMKSVNRGFVIGSTISVVGFMFLGFFYLRFDASYPDYESIRPYVDESARLGQLGHCRPRYAAGLDLPDRHRPGRGLEQVHRVLHRHRVLAGEEPGQVLRRPATPRTSSKASPWAMKARVAAVLIIAAAILASVLIYAGTNATFVAFGVAMCGIGMLTLTGNTISMDVFGPVADNANGIGEMGYDEKEMGEASTRRPGRSWPTSTRWATPPRPSPRASPSARP